MVQNPSGGRVWRESAFVKSTMEGKGCLRVGECVAAASSPLPLSSEAKEREIPGDALPRVALVPHLPWATIMSSLLRDFSLVAQRKLRGCRKMLQPEVEMPVQRSESYFVSHAVVTLTWLVGLGRWGRTSKG